MSQWPKRKPEREETPAEKARSSCNDPHEPIVTREMPSGTHIEIVAWICKCKATTVRVEVVRRDQLTLARETPSYGVTNPCVWCHICRSHTVESVNAEELETVAPAVER